MIQQSDLILLLTELEQEGVEGATQQIRSVITTPGIDIASIKFINAHRPFDVAQFYERLRKNHNEKKSPLYKNIVSDIDNVEEIITTLHAYILQVNLYSKHVENKQLFFKHARAEEVTRVLHKYYTDYDITSALKLIRLIKADLCVFEEILGRRKLEHE